jgi:lipopolysaccharide transport system permease protein
VKASEVRDGRASTPAAVVYRSESRLRYPRELLRSFRTDLRTAPALGWRLMVRDLTAQYRRSLIGVAWAFVPPIIVAVGVTLASRAKVLSFGTTDLPYPAYVMFSTALWQTFVEALNGPIQGFGKAKVMLTRIYLPPEAVLFSQFGQVLATFAIKLVLIVALFVWYGMPVGPTALLAPVALMVLLLFGTLVGLLLAPPSLLYQDVARGVTMLVGAWFFITPVVYPLPASGRYTTVIRLNPVTPLLVTTRELATTGVVSDPVGFLWWSLVTVVGLAAAWLGFRLALPFVLERVGP